MRVFQLRPLNNWFGFLLFHAGVLLVLIALWFIYYNVLTTASVVVSSFDGLVNQLGDNAWLPALQIVRGGQLGKTFGLAFGLLISVLEFVFWASQDDLLGGFAAGAKYIGFALLALDVGSALYFLLGGANLVNVAAALWGWAYVWRVFFAIVIVFAALAFGGELWLAIGIEIIRTQYEVAFAAWGRFFRRLNDLRKKTPDLRQPLPPRMPIPPPAGIRQVAPPQVGPPRERDQEFRTVRPEDVTNYTLR